MQPGLWAYKNKISHPGSVADWLDITDANTTVPDV